MFDCCEKYLYVLFLKKRTIKMLIRSKSTYWCFCRMEQKGSSSLQLHNKVQPGLCVIFNNSCRKNVFKAWLFSQQSRGQRLNQGPPGGLLSQLHLCMLHFSLIEVIHILCYLKQQENDKLSKYYFVNNFNIKYLPKD